MVMTLKILLKILRVYFKNRFLGKRSPVILAHMVTYRCNMRCHYCIYWKWKSYEMNTTEIGKMMNEASELGIAVYTATGGEPLLRNDIDTILKLAKDNGLYTMLVTNGLFLKSRDTSNIDLLTISLDTLDREKFYRITGVDALDRVIEAMKWASEITNTCINVVLHDDNMNEIEDLVRFAESCNVGITFEPVSAYFHGCPNADSKELKKSMLKLLELKREFKCIWNSKQYLKLVYSGEGFNCQPHLLVRVNPNGEVVSPCYDVNYVKTGSLRSKSLKSILESEEYAEGCRIAEKCGRCYLLCYVEPSMIFTSLKWATGSLFDVIRRVKR